MRYGHSQVDKLENHQTTTLNLCSFSKEKKKEKEMGSGKF